ncbi:hypothetical protein EV182_000074 [Spiromyces aspiralis]|uniref:Uncharacterized protein n=1 Tax=Spiromyces aspiralis TaxID=68401 RepID=A0ACC1I112_9FUNG|nr:hypothetical protein EV182_000074 [Spiromyces aspiralis]
MATTEDPDLQRGDDVFPSTKGLNYYDDWKLSFATPTDVSDDSTGTNETVKAKVQQLKAGCCGSGYRTKDLASKFQDAHIKQRTQELFMQALASDPSLLSDNEQIVQAVERTINNTEHDMLEGIGHVCEGYKLLDENLNLHRQLANEVNELDKDIVGINEDIVAQKARVAKIQQACDQQAKIIEKLEPQYKQLKVMADEITANVNNKDAVLIAQQKWQVSVQLQTLTALGAAQITIIMSRPVHAASINPSRCESMMSWLKEISPVESVTIDPLANKITMIVNTSTFSGRISDDHKIRLLMSVHPQMQRVTDIKVEGNPEITKLIRPEWISHVIAKQDVWYLLKLLVQQALQ